MKAIENTSLALLAAAVIFVALVAAAFLMQRYTSYVPSFAPAQNDFSYERSLRESNNLEGLKQMCLRLAENADDARKFDTALYAQFNAMSREVAVLLVMSFTIFGCGLLYIYVLARRLRLGHGAKAS